MRRGWILLSALIAVISQSVFAQASPAPGDALSQRDAAGNGPTVSGFLVGASTVRRPAAMFDDTNPARVPSTEKTVASIIDVRSEAIWARLRLSQIIRDVAATSAAPGTSDTSSRAEVTQFSTKIPLPSEFEFTLGRLNLTFDDGQSFHPLDFLEDAVRTTDFEDRTGRYRGFPLLMLAHASSGAAYRLLYSDDTVFGSSVVRPYADPNPGFNRGQRQWIASARWSTDQTTTTLLARKAFPGTLGIGAAVSRVLSSSLSLHGSAFAARGNDLPIHRNVFLARGTELNRGDVYVNPSPMQPWRADDGKVYLRWLIGSTYTTESGTTFVGELWRDGRGLSQGEQNTWNSVTRFHDGISNSFARTINVAYDLESLRTPFGTQAFFRMALPQPDQHATLQASLLVSTRDESGTANLRWVQQPNPRWEFSVEVWHRFGKPYSQYGTTPDRAGLESMVRFFF